MQLKIYKNQLNAFFRSAGRPTLENLHLGQLGLFLILFLIPTLHYGQASALVNNTLTTMTTNNLPGVVATSSQSLGNDEFSSPGNVTDANLTNSSNYSALLLGNAWIEVKDNNAVGGQVYPVGSFAGVSVEDGALLAALGNFTVTTYLGASVRETVSSTALLSLLSTGGRSEVGFLATQTFDRIRFTYTALLLPDIDVFYMMVEKFGPGAALACNTITKINNPAFPTAINLAHTGTTGVTLSRITNTNTIVTPSDLDFATLSPGVLGVATTTSVSVKMQSGSFGANKVVGYEFSNTGIPGVSLLNNIVIRTFLAGNPVPVETSATNGVLLSVSLSASPDRQKVSFITTLPFDEVQLQFVIPVGVNLGTTQIYNAFVEDFCATNPTLVCNTITQMNNPQFPTTINGAKTGTTGVNLSYFSNTLNVVSASTTDYAVLSPGILGAAAVSSLSVKNMVGTITGPKLVGFEIENTSTVDVGLLNNITINTYLTGSNVPVQTVSGAALLLNVNLLEAAGRSKVSFLATSTFDEVQIQINIPVGVNLGETRIYNAFVEQFCAGPVLTCNTIRALNNPTFPTMVNPVHTGTTGVTVLSKFTNTDFVVSASTTDYATLNPGILGATAVSSLSVRNVVGTFTGSNLVGFELENVSTLNIGLLNNITLNTYIGGNPLPIQSLTGADLLLTINVNDSVGKQRIAFLATLPFDEIQIQISTPVGVNLGETRIYNAFVERFCAGPALACNVLTSLNNPTFPTFINLANTTTTGVTLTKFANTYNVISPSLTDFAVLKPGIIGAAAVSSLSVRSAIGSYTGNNLVGFEIENVSTLNVGLLNNITLNTYLAGNPVPVETLTGFDLLLTINVLDSVGRQKIGFLATMPFDEIQIQINTPVGVNLGETRVFNCFVERFCAGPALACNTVTKMNNPAFPTYVNPKKTTTTGVTLTKFANTYNVITADPNDYAVLKPGVLGVATTSSLSVRSALGSFTGPKLVGFEIENVNLLNLGLLGNITINTYMADGLTPVESATGNDLILSLGLLDSLGRQQITFLATMPFDEFQIQINTPVGVNLGETRVFNTIIETFCAGPALVCNTVTKLNNPTYPTIVNQNNTGASGVNLTKFNNTYNVVSPSLTDYAVLTPGVAAVAAVSSLSDKNVLNSYSGTKLVGFEIENLSTVNVGLLNNITLKTYISGNPVAVDTAVGQGLLVNIGLLEGSGKRQISFLTDLPFDEVQIEFNLPVGVNLGETRIYNAFVENFCVGLPIPCNTIATLVNPLYPTIVNPEKTGTTGLTLSQISEEGNVVSPSTSDYAVLSPGILAVGAVTSLSVKNVLSTFTGTRLVGFEIENLSPVNVGLLNTITLKTYLSGDTTPVETATTEELLLDVQLLEGSGLQKISFIATQPFDEIQIQFNVPVGVNLGETHIYNAFTQQFCGGQVLACNTLTQLNNPAFPTMINPANTGTNGIGLLSRFSDSYNAISADTSDYALLSPGVLVLATESSLSVANVVDNYTGSKLVGFEIENLSPVDVGLLNTITINTYLDGDTAVVESSTGSGLILEVDLLEGSGKQKVSFLATQPFDEAQIVFNIPVGVDLGDTRIYNAFVETYCAGAALACNTITNWNNPAFPTYINPEKTGTTGIALSKFDGTHNLVSPNPNDFAVLNPGILGVAASSTISVKSVLDTYTGPKLVGFEVENVSGIDVAVLGNMTIRTYLDGDTAAVEVATGMDLLLGASLWEGHGRQKVSFLATEPFDEVQIQFNTPVGVNLGETRVYNAFIENFCAGQVLPCNTLRSMNSALNPLYINNERTNITGAACVLCEFYDFHKVIDGNSATAAVINTVGAVGAVASLSVRNALADYPADTYAAFEIGTRGILGSNVASGISLTFYNDGVEVHSTSNPELLVGVGTDLLIPRQHNQVGVVCPEAFDEVQISFETLASVTLDTIEIFNFFLQNNCERNINCNSTVLMITPLMPVVINMERTGVSGGACVGCEVGTPGNIVDLNVLNAATIITTVGAAAATSISVLDAKHTYYPGTFAGFAVLRANSPTAAGLFNYMTITTYLDGVMQEQIDSSDLLDLSLLSIVIDPPAAGLFNIGIQATKSFDEIQISYGNVVNVLDVTLGIVAAFAETSNAIFVGGLNPKICFKTNPDFNVAQVNTLINGNVSSNDIINDGPGVYTNPQADPGNPGGETLVLNPNGTYTFTSPNVGVYTYLINVCEAGETLGCKMERLTITVKEEDDTDVPTANTDIASVQGAADNPPSVIIPVKNNDEVGNDGGSLGIPSIVTGPDNGDVTVNPDGTITYTPDEGFSGIDIFVYKVCETPGVDLCAQAIVEVTVLPENISNTTSAADDFADGPSNLTITGNVSSNDIDPEGNSQTVTPINTSVPAGTLVLSSNGDYVFTPTLGFVGSVDFVYTTCDNGSPSACAKATLHILVKAAEGPDFTPSNDIISLNFPAAGSSRDVVINIAEVLNSPSTGQVQFNISKLSAFDITYNINATTATVFGPTPVNNGDWLFTENANFITVTLKPGKVIAGNGFSPVGFTITRKAGVASNTSQNITSIITPGSGGDINFANNIAVTTITAN